MSQVHAGGLEVQRRDGRSGVLGDGPWSGRTPWSRESLARGVGAQEPAPEFVFEDRCLDAHTCACLGACLLPWDHPSSDGGGLLGNMKAADGPGCHQEGFPVCERHGASRPPSKLGGGQDSEVTPWGRKPDVALTGLSLACISSG